MTSVLFEKGKKMFLITFEKLPNLDGRSAAFEEGTCLIQRLFENGMQTLSAVYNFPKSVNIVSRSPLCTTRRVNKFE